MYMEIWASIHTIPHSIFITYFKEKQTCLAF